MSQIGTNTTQTICCPQCGSPARRLYFTSSYPTHLKCPGGLVNQVECPSCDYLMVSCAVDGQVVEAYAEGISTYHHSTQPGSPDKPPLPMA
ncbi:hypothetical protein [Acaryochloris marina]|nr:hypothetical protein [Acaryochloris marina]BDM79218.1 hypothetical protein AM10699_20860 [Acaryochloris marina MBIC10699]